MVTKEPGAVMPFPGSHRSTSVYAEPEGNARASSTSTGGTAAPSSVGTSGVPDGVVETDEGAHLTARAGDKLLVTGIGDEVEHGAEVGGVGRELAVDVVVEGAAVDEVDDAGEQDDDQGGEAAVPQRESQAEGQARSS